MKKEGWAIYNDWLGKYRAGLNIKPKNGETWHLRITNASCLSTWTITDITERTVVLKDPNSWNSSRYLIRDIEFVEKV